jgi:guanylate kinase
MVSIDLEKLIPDLRRGLMLVMSSPSGAGKTSISRKLMAAEKDLAMSVSVTTRPKRPGEVDGEHYHFIDQRCFRAMADGGDLLEHAEVYGHSYGTPKAPVEQVLASGRDVLFDIDWQGAQQLRTAAAEDMVGIFFLPPSTEELARRLRTRAQDSEEVVRYRLSQVVNDITHWAEYDYVLINNDLEVSVEAVRAILASERLKRRRQLRLGKFVQKFRTPPG